MDTCRSSWSQSPRRASTWAQGWRGRRGARSKRPSTGWEAFLLPSSPVKAAAALLTEEEFRKHPLSMQTTTASFGSYRSQGTATDLLADVSMTQARQTGQDVLSAVTATVPEPFGPQLSTAKVLPRSPKRRSRPPTGPGERPAERAAERAERAEREPREDAKEEKEPPAPKKSLFKAVSAIMQAAKTEKAPKAHADRPTSSLSDRSGRSGRSTGSRRSSRSGRSKRSGRSGRSGRSSRSSQSQRRKSSGRSSKVLQKAAQAFKTALSAVAGETANTTSGSRRRSVAERLTMSSATRHAMDAKDAERSKAPETDAEDPARPPRSPERKTRSASKVERVSTVEQAREEASKAPRTAATPGMVFAPQEKPGGKWKWTSQAFEAPLCSFQELVNVENTPMLLAEAVERVRPMCGGQNFSWERSHGSYGGKLHINFPIVLWYQHSWENEIKKSRTSCAVSFLHRSGCAFVYQPTVPVTTLIIEPKQIFRPMFHFDPRSFHTFKLAWRHYLDFDSTDYRLIVGSELERWCQRCSNAIEKPFNATYWLLLMIGSLYRETLTMRNVVPKLDPPEQVAVICVDSFVALSALLFAPERQVLYAGVDPTPSYLRWLQYIADQNNFRKTKPVNAANAATVFEMNEFLDLPVVIIFYGRPSRGKEADPLAWTGNPTLVKSYISRFCEDNKCGCQVELATRLYTYSCSLGCTGPGDGHQPWFCWNGLQICEIGVPMPHTQAAFLSPFLSSKYVAFLCHLHGPDGYIPSEKQKGTRGRLDSKQSSQMEGNSDLDEPEKPTRSSSMKTGSLMSTMDNGPESCAASQAGDSDEEESESRRSWSFNTQSGLAGVGKMEKEKAARSGYKCSCGQYIFTEKGAAPRGRGAKADGPAFGHTEGEAAKLRQALAALQEYDLMHTFVALMSGGLNLAKSVLRLHFSIDPGAYQNLPEPSCKSYEEALMPWYREFHRMDMHNRSRHCMLLTSILRGMLGDGLTSGLHTEALDMLRLPLPTADEKEKPDKVPALRPMLGRPTVGPGAQHSLFGGAQRSPSQILQRQQSRESLASDERPDRQTSKAPGSKRFLTHAQVSCALNGCDSPLGLKHHFETFQQWCHSAHLLPFVQRCYRRCGIAGLAAGQHVGRHSKGANPFYPLVLPTVPTVFYGHCYPLHKVFQYFYAGTEKILCSIDDSKALDSEKATWGLVAGQDRLNNQCWFKVADEVDPMNQESDSRDSREPSKKSALRSSMFPLTLKPSGKSIDEERRQQLLARKKHFVAKRQMMPLSPGVLTAADPFFWFCHGDFYLYTFPANQVPRNFLQDPAVVVCRYADIVSRSGTPPPDAGLGVAGPTAAARATARGVAAMEQSAAAPPSSCLCQPTDMTDHLRKRWEVKLVFPDEQALLLGDTGWFPGALGYRFIFEASTQNVERYVLLDTMPQASLVYMQHVWRPDRKLAKTGKKAAKGPDKTAAGWTKAELREAETSSDESEVAEEPSEREDPIAAPHRRRIPLPYFYKKKKPPKKQRPGIIQRPVRWETVDFMLPPLGPGL